VSAASESPAQESRARLRRPDHWHLRHVDHAGWFTTGMTWDLPDGISARWSSRQARRRGRVELRDSSGAVTGTTTAHPVTARRLGRINLVAAISFMIGGSLFALGAFLAQNTGEAARTIDTVYLVGGFFFSLGGYTSVLQASNAPTEIDADGSLAPTRWRWWDNRPHNLGWLGATVLFVGTLLFAVSLVAAFAEDLTVRQSNTWIWVPDMLGCLCFLASGHLGFLEVCHGRLGVRIHEIGWWVVAVNQVGSVLFFLAGVAAYTLASDTALDLGLANWGTFWGAVCFVAGGLVQAFDKPE
jgi:hypothetical protein